MASQSAVTHLTRPDKRDPSSVNLAFINASIAQSSTEDRHERLNQLCSIDLIAAYDYISMGSVFEKSSSDSGWPYLVQGGGSCWTYHIHDATSGL